MADSTDILTDCMEAVSRAQNGYDAVQLFKDYTLTASREMKGSSSRSGGEYRFVLPATDEGLKVVQLARDKLKPWQVQGMTIKGFQNMQKVATWYLTSRRRICRTYAHLRRVVHAEHVWPTEVSQTVRMVPVQATLRLVAGH